MIWLQELLASIWFPYIIALLAALLIQLVYYWLIFSRLAFYNGKKRPVSEVKEAVSVVICAKNEYHNLVRYLPLILEQDYPEYEVVVVNDASDDDTFYLLRELSDKYSHLKLVNITHNLNFFSGKKFPLSIGIKSARHDLVLLTDWNWPKATPGKGSAIFLHRWRRPGYPTAGCVAFAPHHLRWIAERITPGTRLIVR